MGDCNRHTFLSQSLNIREQYVPWINVPVNMCNKLINWTQYSLFVTLEYFNLSSIYASFEPTQSPISSIHPISKHYSIVLLYYGILSTLHLKLIYSFHSTSFIRVRIHQTWQTFIYLNSTLARNNLIENHLLCDVHLGMLKRDGYHQILVAPIALSNC